jgi:polysaccharide export outer membrane protein
VFWRDKDLSTDALVRPDGKISMPLLNDIQAEGLTPIQLRNEISAEAKHYVQDPNVTIVVRQINSRKVFITGEVEKPGSYPLTAQMTVLQLIATAGGLKEYADAKHIAVVRTENGHQISYPFNFKDVSNPETVKQNINLKPGDAVIVR